MPKILKPAVEAATEEKIESTKKPVSATGKTKSAMKASADEVVEPRGSVYYSKSVTKNMGNFNSAKIEVAITLNFGATPDDAAEAVRVMRMADAIIEKELDEQVSTLTPEPEKGRR